MLFSVIFSVNVPEDEDVMDFAPPQVEELWDETESGDSEYSYLEGDRENGTHKKWCAILNREQFKYLHPVAERVLSKPTYSIPTSFLVRRKHFACVTSPSKGQVHGLVLSKWRHTPRSYS